MSIKSVLMVAAVCVCTLPVVNAKNAAGKTYSVEISEPSSIGSTQLPKGEYKLRVDGANAIFTSQEDSQKTISAAVKIDTGTQKFGQTAVVTGATKNGVATIQEIELGGSTTKLEFGQ